MKQGPFNDYEASGTFTIPITPLVDMSKVFSDIDNIKFGVRVNQYGTMSWSETTVSITSNAIICKYEGRINHNEAFPYYVTLTGDWRIIEYY